MLYITEAPSTDRLREITIHSLQSLPKFDVEILNTSRSASADAVGI